MAFNVNKSIEWQAGAGTPAKYGVAINATCDLVNVSGATATFSLIGTVTVTNHPYNSMNSFAASDIAALTPGDKDPRNYSFSPNTSYYQHSLPFLPNAPASYVDSILFQFRGDTERPNPNRSSLYVKGAGVVVDADSSEFSRSYTINTTFQLTLDGSSSQPVLIWNSSGAGSSTEYGWAVYQVWATMLDFDYRPGETWNGANWMSHNRDGGVCDVFENGGWSTMRTQDGGVGTGNPPLCFHDGQFLNQYKIGQE